MGQYAEFEMIVNASLRHRSYLNEEFDRLLIKFPSHRSRDYALKLLGGKKRQSYYSFDRDSGYGVYEVTDKEFEMLTKGMKPNSFKRFKDGPDIRKSWSNSNES